MSASGFSFSGWFAGVRTQLAGRQYIFGQEPNSISVREEYNLAHSGGAASRARCSETGIEFDLRRLRLGAEAGGHVTLAMLQALERESNLAMQAGGHPHSIGCHASLVENIGIDHSRLLLCDPCCEDLAAHTKANGGALPAETVTEIGQQLALGLRHLHALDILCGGVTPHGILLGCDGKWKLLGDLHGAVQLPCSLEEWRKLRGASPLLPPEARCTAQTPLKAEGQVTLGLDIWMLGALLAGLLHGIDDRGIGGTRAGNAVLAATEDVLLCPFAARLWMLLHWLLATEVAQRPWSRRLVEVIHSLYELWPQDLLIEMPEYARFHCQGMAAAAARRLAVASVGGTAAKRSCTAGLPLEVLRQSMADPSDVDRLCENCGLELEEYSGVSKDEMRDVPSLVPMLCEPSPEPASVESGFLSPKQRCRSHCFHTDESTDEGSASGDESTASFCARSDSPCEAAFGRTSPTPSGSIIPRQRRPMALAGEL